MMRFGTEVLILTGEMQGTYATVREDGKYWVDVRDHIGRDWSFRHDQIAVVNENINT